MGGPYAEDPPGTGIIWGGEGSAELRGRTEPPDTGLLRLQATICRYWFPGIFLLLILELSLAKSYAFVFYANPPKNIQ